jgi:TolB-like protein/Flp pilus assembly protein TadD/tRNA A-37 threonylcarbamoyl transferase component Bud32
VIGQTVRNYQVLEPLGRGGGGVVYKARDTRLGRLVALKFLPEHLRGDDEVLKRFEREARSASALNHPGICTIYEVGEHQDHPFLAMELLEGGTLAERLRRGPLPPAELLSIAVQIVEALEAVHALGIVHRDLKPANVFVSATGRVKVLDFGIAKLSFDMARTLDRITDTGIAPGTIPYMSPEQALAEPVDTRSDLFSLGAVLYEMATGQIAFSGKSPALAFDAVLNRMPPPPSSLNPDVPAGLDEVVATALRRNRAERYQTAAELRADLVSVQRQWESGVAAAAGTAPVRPSWTGSRRRRRLPAGRTLAVATPLALVALAAGGLLLRTAPRAYDSIAVLPFADTGDAGEPAYLGDGITESLINGLSRLGRLRVVPRGTVFRYRGRETEAEAVGRELKVAVVVTGRVLRRGDELTVGAELIDVEKDAQIWGERYQRGLDEVLPLQEQITGAIAERLGLGLTEEERRSLKRRHTENRQAYRLFLQGRHEWDTRTVEGLSRSIELFRQAIALDPSYALAHSGLADAYVALRDAPPRETRPRAREAALAALELDGSLAEAHTSLAMTHFVFDWDWESAETRFRRAIELSPEHVTARHWYGLFLMAMGRFGEARAQMARAQELDPRAPMVRVNVARIELLAGRREQALRLLGEAVAVQDDFAWTHGFLSLVHALEGRFPEAVAAGERATALDDAADADTWAGYAYAKAGRRAEARRSLARLEAAGRTGYLPPFRVALVHTALGDADQAFAWLEKAFADRSPWMAYVKTDPALAELRGDPRFQDLLRRLRLE